ncbi:MAG: hypothetical protein Q7O66_21315 [Dehalococcoidia bacterium]|nr:hypothetical protein [Dehalococcoidia bacterium]
MPRRLWFVFLILPATAAMYLGYVAWLGTEISFPLDDAWIHQTFARNLVLRGEFAYNPGEPSTASTSPLWTLLLSAGYLFSVGFRPWAYGLGLLFLGLTSWVGFLLAGRLFPGRPRLPVLAALAILLEWHLAWAALSGMETILFSLLCLSLIYLTVLSFEERLSPSRLCLLGTLAGLAAVVRPEGVILAAIAFGVLVWRNQSRRWIGVALCLTILVVLPAAAFNQIVAGTPLPSTYYAKQSAYARPLSLSFAVSYVGSVIGTLSEGPLIMLLPGLAYVVYQFAGRTLDEYRHFASSPPSTEGRLFPLSRSVGRLKVPQSSIKAGPLAFIGIWVVVMIVLYMVKLPALFHHGRYFMPLIPPLLIVGLGGLVGLLEVVPYRVLARLYCVLAAMLFLVLWVNGSIVYGWDVKFIVDEDIAVARWLNSNTPADAVVATHDIGAIGYFSGRTLLDTAGLITPELGPYVRDQQKILAYLEARRVNFLAVYPKWYPSIVADSRFQEVFAIKQTYAIPAGADNMKIYQARW